MSDFWTSEKGYKIYENGPINMKVLKQKCPEDCLSAKIGDGTCDQDCNTIACLWDGDDCDGVIPVGMAFNMYGPYSIGRTRFTLNRILNSRTSPKPLKAAKKIFDQRFTKPLIL